jgi:hypothetical protein
MIDNNQRFTEGSITDLVEDPSKLYPLGKCTFRGGYLDNFLIILTTPKHRAIKIKTDREVSEMNQEAFEDIIKKYLNENRLFLADAEYEGKRYCGIKSKRVHCELYSQPNTKT